MFDNLATARTAMESLARDFEPTTLTGPQAVRVVAELGTIRRLADGLLAKAARRVEETSAHARGNDRDAAALAAKAMGTSSSEARQMIRTAADLEALPATDAAVREGKLSARQARLVADAAKINPAAELELIAAAAGGLVALNDACIKARAAVENSADRAKRQHRSRSLQIWTDSDGMVGGRFSLAPEIGGQVKTLIDGLTQKIFRRHRSNADHEPMDAYAADALAETILGEEAVTAATPDSPEVSERGDVVGEGEVLVPAGKPGVQYTVHILIDHAALLRGEIREGETCEIAGVGPVNLEWVRAMLGSAFLTAVIKNGKDIATVAHLGRHIPAELRTALIVAGRECDVAGCNHRGYLEVDHSEVDYAKGGPTAWWNLTWLCHVHHRRKTAGATLGPPDPHTRKRTMNTPGIHPDQQNPRAA